jgi:hypothetical protein
MDSDDDDNVAISVDEEIGNIKSMFRLVADDNEILMLPLSSALDNESHSSVDEKQFRYVIGSIANALSFKQVVKQVRLTVAETRCAQLGRINDEKVSTYAQLACVVGLSGISHLLRKTWAYAIAADGSTHRGISYFDIRVRLYWDGALRNLHVVAIPEAGHSGEAMFNIIAGVFDILDPLWKSKIIGASTDGAANMVGRLVGVVSRIRNVAESGFVSVWCINHQIDLVLQDGLSSLKDPNFLHPFTGSFGYESDLFVGLIGYLRKQPTFIEDQGSCPKWVKTRWVTTWNSSSWLKARCSAITRLLANNVGGSRPDHEPADGYNAWWPMLSAVEAFSALFWKASERLQVFECSLFTQSTRAN